METNNGFNMITLFGGSRTLEQIYLTPYPETESRANMFSKLPVGNIIQEERTIILLLNFKKYT